MAAFKSLIAVSKLGVPTGKVLGMVCDSRPMEPAGLRHLSLHFEESICVFTFLQTLNISGPVSKQENLRSVTFYKPFFLGGLHGRFVLIVKIQ